MSILEVKDLSKHYPKFDLKKVSFTLEPGSIMGFIGRNGAGKTTTLKTIMNLVHRDGGDVYMFGNNYFENEQEDKKNIGFFLAEHDYYLRKKVKNITKVTKRFYPDWDDEKYYRFLKAFNIDENKCIKDLSNGMKVKYQLAIALSHDAKLLIFDEPTSGLDPVSRDELLELFKKIVKDKKHSILFSTHITSDLESCADMITYIHNGEIILSESKTKFLNSYLLLEGKEALLSDGLKKAFISFRVEDGVFKGMVKSDYKVDNPEIKITQPNLQDIMVYTERTKEDEEFII